MAETNIEQLLANLLAPGYFPRELPPCFSTLSFAIQILNNRTTWPAAFQPRTPTETKMCTYSLARAGGLRRKLSVPNPISHLQLCNFLAPLWDVLVAHCNASPISLSKPVLDLHGQRAVVPAVPLGELPIVRAVKRSNAKYVVRTDISEFYPSLYTHSVPWAIHTKATAKSHRNDTNLRGNKLDKLLRSSQGLQTVGIPIGPDTSLVVAEIVLSAVDQELAKRIPNLRGVRHMDDFELHFSDPAAAERGLAALHETLLEFELRLNPRKTTVEQAPIRIESEWVHTFRHFSFSHKSSTQRQIEENQQAVAAILDRSFSHESRTQTKDLIRYFDYLTKYIRENPQEHVVNYALARIKDLEIEANDWDLYQSLLASAVTVEPGAVRTYIDILRCNKKGHVVAPALTESTLNAIIERSAPLGHHHEVAWSLWAILFFDLRVHKEAADAISKVDNSFVALLALDAERNGLVPSGLDKTEWKSRMTPDDLYEDQWLLCYEANVKDWLPSVGGGDHVVDDECFGYLKSLGVEFYTPVRALAGPAEPLVVTTGYFG